MKKFILITMLAVLFSFIWAAQHDYIATDSPGQYEYTDDTYLELGWTDIDVSQTDVLTGVQIAYTWTTDTWAYEGSFHIESPLGTTAQIAAGQATGTYNVTVNDFNGQAMNGIWKLYIQDSYGDGGHQATDVTVSFHYAEAGAPGAVINPSPANAAVDVAPSGNLSWDFGADTDTYQLWFGPAGNMTMVDSGAAGATGSYAYSNLGSLETYNWRVISQNASRMETPGPLWSFTTMMQPITTFPWVEDFGTVAGDWPVQGWTQLSGLYPTPTGTSAQWFRDEWVNGPVGNNAAKINIWSTTRNGWLVSHPVDIPADGYEFKFDLGLTTYGGTNPVVAGNQPDDRFLVIMSDSPDMSNPILLREWNNTGSPYVYDNIPNTGMTVNIQLAGVIGVKYFAFYGESTVSNGDNDLFVDNVTVREIPSAAIFSITPAITALNFGNVLLGGYAEQVFTISNTGGADLSLGSIGIDPAGTDFSIPDYAGIDWVIAPGDNTQFTVRFEPQTVGAQNADLDIVFTREDYTVALSGAAYTPATLPLTEDWEAGQGNWNIVNGTQTNAWHIGTADPYAGAYSAYISNDGGVSNSYTIDATSVSHLYTDIAFDADMLEYSLSFMWKCYGEGTAYDKLRVYLVDTTVTPVAGTALTAPQVGLANYNLQSDWIQGTITLPGTVSGSVQRLVFSWSNDSSVGTNPPINLDDISLIAVPFPTGPPNPVTLTYPANEASGLPIDGFELSWTPDPAGGTPSYYALFMSQDEATIYEDRYYEVTGTSFDPTQDLSDPIIYAYEDRWYWTVEAYNSEGSALQETINWFEIQAAPQVIDTFPWIENFDASTALPQDWSMYDLDGGGTSWIASAAQSHSAPNSFLHSFSTAIPEPGQDGWLITPAVQLPAAGSYVLSWWNYNAFPTWMVYNGVWVGTSNDPADASWTEIWAADTAAAAWSNAVVNIEAYLGQTVYFAFVYQGYDADNWFVDDVSVFELLIDEIPPTITHLPLLNTPIDDAPYSVVAHIVDDSTWNNPIASANIYYSTDDGTTWSAPLAMVLSEGLYYADIPAQPLTNVVDYYITAEDSEGNLATSNTFSFAVDNPIWVWYDQGGTTYMGYDATDFGPTVLFDNPFYGTGASLQLLATDGSSYYGGHGADLVIYSYDGVDMLPVYTQPVTFGAQTYEVFDISAQNVLINTPYFLIAYENVPMGNYILFDGTYDYGTTFINIAGELYTMSSPGSWSIGAYITDGLGTDLDAPVVTITLDINGYPELTWDAVAGASSYYIEGAMDPYATTWTQIDNVTGTSYTYTAGSDLHFFRVIASEETPIRNVISATPFNLNARSIEADQAPKTPINIRK